VAGPLGPITDVPALVTTDDDPWRSAPGKRGDITNPAQVATRWWSGLMSDITLARALTYDPDAWGDYQWAVDQLDGRSLASKVIPAVDAPDRVAFMRFVPEIAGSAARVFGAYRISATFLTMVKVQDGTWRVWGLGPTIPSARDILGDP
jgi:hypothetical protein